MKAVIVSNGVISDYDYAKKICDNSFVICCDGAISHCVKMNITPNAWIGDGDSCVLSNAQFEKALYNCKIIKLPVEKDMTDTEYACDYVVEKGFSNVTLVGCFGGRLDHEISNLYMLKRLHEKNIKAVIRDEKNTVFVADKYNVIKKGSFKYVSIVLLSDKLSGVTTDGLKYPVNNQTLYKYESKSISNELTGDCATVSICDGDALIMLTDD